MPQISASKWAQAVGGRAGRRRLPTLPHVLPWAAGTPRLMGESEPEDAPEPAPEPRWGVFSFKVILIMLSNFCISCRQSSSIVIIIVFDNNFLLYFPESYLKCCNLLLTEE